MIDSGSLPRVPLMRLTSCLRNIQSGVFSKILIKQEYNPDVIYPFTIDSLTLIRVTFAA